jgi:predicted Zn finger-like uncharacterized protein
MANTFVILCPECEKQIKVADEVVGKKIRCKECGNVFTVKRPKGVPAAQAKAKDEAKKPEDEAKKGPAATASTTPTDDDDDGKSPYSLAATDDGIARCPNCVKELESADARICLQCGYNLETRKRQESRAVYEPTSEEKFQWLLPGILSIVGILVLIGICIFVCVKVRGWMTGGWFQDEDDGRWIVRPGCFMLFSVMMTGFASFYLGRFAYRRLVVNNRPPEREIEKEKVEED